MSNLHLFIENKTNPPTVQSVPNIALAAIVQIGGVLISSYKTQILFLLSKSKIVGLESSPDWGVLLPEIEEKARILE